MHAECRSTAWWIIFLVFIISAQSNIASATPQPSQPAAAASNQNSKPSVAGGGPASSEAESKSSRRGTDNIEAESVSFAVGISSRVPVGASDSFESSVGGLYFWSRLRIRNTPAEIKHIWYHDDKKVGEYNITARFKHTRLWTFRNVKPGLWRVEITDKDGNTVAVATCIVRSSSKDSSASKASAH